jgi:hypothetical protein
MTVPLSGSVYIDLAAPLAIILSFEREGKLPDSTAQRRLRKNEAN